MSSYRNNKRYKYRKFKKMMIDKDKVKEAGEKVEKKLGAWAKYTLYGLAIVVFIILSALGLTSCSAGMSITLKSDKGELTWTVDGKDVQSVPVVIQQKK